MTYSYTEGLLHTWLTKPRNRLFRRALAMRAIFCAARLSRASMAAQAALTCALATPVEGSVPHHFYDIYRSGSVLEYLKYFEY